MVDKDEFTQFVREGYTIQNLMDCYNISRTRVHEIKKSLGIINLTPNGKRNNHELTGIKTCISCNETKSLNDFYSNGYQANGNKKYKGKCKTCENTYRKQRFDLTVNEVLLTLNKTYECELCGYNKNTSALVFHHEDPSLKEFSISELSKTYSTDKLVNLLTKELIKCQVLCANCHAEVHNPHLNRDLP